MAMSPILSELLRDYALHLRRRGRASIRLREEGNTINADAMLEKLTQEIKDEDNVEVLHWIIYHMMLQDEDVPNSKKRKS
jgi:hypothetical protein